MKSFLVAALAAISTIGVNGINILLSNDDGFASAQLVETFRLLRANGHNVVAVASGMSCALLWHTRTNDVQLTTNPAKVDDRCSRATAT